MNFLFYVEGQTEQAFVKAILKPHLESLGAYSVKSTLVETSRKDGKRTFGGGDKWEDARKGLVDLLMIPYDDHCFTTMFDLYELFRGFPGAGEAKHIDRSQDQVLLLEQSLADDIKDKRFIPYIQLHEFEALLFADCEKLGNFFDSPAKGKQARNMVDKAGGPEAINGGGNTAPSKRLKKLFPNYSKDLDGPAILREVGLNFLRTKCGHFDEWLTKLESEINGRL